jgi:hypothetical protein
MAPLGQGIPQLTPWSTDGDAFPSQLTELEAATAAETGVAVKMAIVAHAINATR